MVDSYSSHPSPHWANRDRLFRLIPKNLSPFDYQLAALERFELLNYRMLLPHPPGAGKTATALMAAHLYGGTTVVICPPAVTVQWAKQAATWGHTTNVRILDTMENAKRFVATPGISIIPDSLVRATSVSPCDLLIVDESHRFKAANASRTKRTLGKGGWADSAKKVLLMSGSPSPNGACDLFTSLYALDIEEAASWRKYSSQYCPAYTKYLGTRKIQCYDRGANLQDLNRVMRTKAIHLPPLGDIQAQLPLRRTDRMRLPVHTGYCTEEEALAAFEKLSPTERDTSGTAFASARRALGTLKAEAATDLLSTLIEGGDRPLIWVWHRAVAHTLSARLGIPAIYGGIPDVIRKANIADFVAGKIPALIASLSTIGTGYDGLQHATDFAVFVERSYVPADNDQAEARIHRTGQRKPCRFLVLTSHDPMDAALDRILAKKTTDNKEIHA